MTLWDEWLPLDVFRLSLSGGIPGRERLAPLMLLEDHALELLLGIAPEPEHRRSVEGLQGIDLDGQLIFRHVMPYLSSKSLSVLVTASASLFPFFM